MTSGSRSEPDDLVHRTVEEQGLRLTQLAYLLSGDLEHADQLVTRAFARAWWRGPLRREARDVEEVRRTLVRSLTATQSWSGGRRQPATHPAPAAEASTPSVDAELATRLLRMPPLPRAAAALRSFEGLDEAQVATELGVDPEALPAQTAEEVARNRRQAETARHRPPLDQLVAPSPAMVRTAVNRRRRNVGLSVVGATAVLLVAVLVPYLLTSGPSAGSHTVVLGSGGKPPSPRSTTATTPTSGRVPSPSGGASGSTTTPGGGGTSLPIPGFSRPRGTGSNSSTSSTTPTATSVATEILAPATAPPVVAECSETITVDASGRVAPLTCPDGGINVLAWHAFAKRGPSVMALGPGASGQQVTAAMCSDLLSPVRATPAQEIQAAQLAARYNGWTVDPTAFDAARCPSGSGTTSTP